MDDQLLVIICVVTFCHAFKTVLSITKMVLAVQLLYFMKFCTTDTEELGQAKDNKDCNELPLTSPANMLYLGSMCCTFTEIFCVLMLVTMAKIKQRLTAID